MSGLLEFTILGCGSSGGVPRADGEWGVCDPANPKNARSRCSLLELIDEMERIVGHALPRNREPERVGDVKHSQADSSRLMALFPDVGPVPLTEGVRATVDWMTSTR